MLSAYCFFLHSHFSTKGKQNTSTHQIRTLLLHLIPCEIKDTVTYLRFFGMTSSCYSTQKIWELGSCWACSRVFPPRLIGFWSNPSEYHLTLTTTFTFTPAPTTPSAAKYVHKHLHINSPHWGGTNWCVHQQILNPCYKAAAAGWKWPCHNSSNDGICRGGVGG